MCKKLKVTPSPLLMQGHKRLESETILPARNALQRACDPFPARRGAILQLYIYIHYHILIASLNNINHIAF